MCSEDENSSAVDNPENYLVTLGELTEYENAVWRFPDTTRCPSRSCSMVFSTRAMNLEHYRDNHAKHSVLCRICDYPLMLLTASHHLLGHYARVHPNDCPPVKTKTARHECMVCHSTFKNYVYLHNHMNKLHRARSKKEKKRKAWNKRKSKATLSKVSTAQNESLLTSKSSVKSDKVVVRSNTRSPSWEDIDSDTPDDASPVTADNTHGTAVNSSSQAAEMNSLRQLVKRKATSFNVKQKSRPCTICGRHLKNYIIACNHYRKEHGRMVSMCSFCHKYFIKSTALIQHMKKFHQFRNEFTEKLNPSTESAELTKLTKIVTKKNKGSKKKEKVVSKSVPSRRKPLKSTVPTTALDVPNLIAEIDESVENGETMEVPIPFENGQTADGDVIDDIISIGGMTEYPTMQWSFPDITFCPRTNCKGKFNTRAEAFEHYRDQHSNYDVQCKECNVLVSLSGAHNLINHYKRRHPHADLPAKVNDNKVACHICQKVLSFQQMRVHLFTKHNEGAPSTSSKTKKSDRILKRRKTMNPKRIDSESESKKAKSSARSLLRSKSICHCVYMATTNDVNKETAQDVETAQVPIANDVPSEPTQANELNESREQQTHNPPQTKQITQHTEVKLNDQHKSSACESNSELPARQKTRSTGVRIKGCTICGVVLSNYVIACEHYHQLHGRNVMMCPYCEQYFLQSHLLTKHVIATHSKQSVYAEMTKMVEQEEATAGEKDKGAKDAKNDIDLPNAFDVEIHNVGAHDTNPPKLSAVPTTQPVEQDAIAAATNQCNQFIQQDNEPLNLSVKNNVVLDFGVIDLKSGALDLSIKK